MQQESDPTLTQEKEIIAELEQEYQAYQKEKPTATGYARYARRSRALIFRLQRLSRDAQSTPASSNLNAFDGATTVHIHSRDCSHSKEDRDDDKSGGALIRTGAS